MNKWISITTLLIVTGSVCFGWTSKDIKKLSSDEIKKKLTAIQYNVTQNEGTEQPFRNEYWHNKDQGIYVDIISGEPLFSSNEKYDSGTGWPSFTQVLAKENIIEKSDKDHSRTEVRSRLGNSHLGHVFSDGPSDKGGLRYCMNSASMRFIPKEKLKEAGYSEYLKNFDSKQKK
jgi:peptide-methionine (R)-S-oxide reductase